MKQRSHFLIQVQIITEKYFMRGKITIIGTEDDTFFDVLLNLFARSNI